MKLKKEILIKQLIPEMKKKGYKKKNNNWMLKHDDLSFILNIQSSFYSDDYYINLGISINKLSNTNFPPINECHIWERLKVEITEISLLCKILDKWIEWYSDINTLRKKAIENKLPITTKKDAKTYLTTL
jgi:hypothetical protein